MSVFPAAGHLGPGLPGQDPDRWQAPLGQATRGNQARGDADRVRWATARSRDAHCRPNSGGWPAASARRRRPWPWAIQVLVIAWHLLTNDYDYADLGGDYFVHCDADRARQRAVAHSRPGLPGHLQPVAA
jgi:hypothetical protein